MLFFFKAKKNAQKPESFCLFNSSEISRTSWEVSDLPRCLLTFLIIIMTMHKLQFCIFEKRMTVVVAFMTISGGRQHCLRSETEENQWFHRYPDLHMTCICKAQEDMDMKHIKRLSTSKDLP